MRLNDAVIDTFISDYIKNYLISTKHEFLLEEQVTIIYNSSLSLMNKYEMLKERLLSTLEKSNNENKQYSYKMDMNELRKQIIQLMDNIVTISQVEMHNNKRYTVCFMDPILNEYNCATSLGSLLSRYTDEDTRRKLASQRFTIVDSINSVVKAVISIDESFKIKGFTILDESMQVELGNKYTKIPNDIDVGDVVTISGDTEHRKYVVVSVPNMLKALEDEYTYTDDASIEVIPIEVLSEVGKSYKYQIDDVISARINNVDTNEDCDDIISNNQLHLHLSFVEKEQG